jgi:hypothetical protein
MRLTQGPWSESRYHGQVLRREERFILTIIVPADGGYLALLRATLGNFADASLLDSPTTTSKLLHDTEVKYRALNLLGDAVRDALDPKLRAS